MKESRRCLEGFKASAETIDENLYSRLITALFSINAVADDAEQKQINNFHVNQWLLEVKDGVLDAQDLLEEIHIQVSKSKQEAAESRTSSTRTNQLLGMLNVSPSYSILVERDSSKT